MTAFSLLTPNLISANPKSLNLFSFLKPLSINSNLSLSSSKSLSLANVSLRKGLGFVRNVAVSSEYEEEVVSGEEEGGVEEISHDLKLFVGNLPFSVDSAELAGLFNNAGNVEVVEVIYDRMTGRSRGFGFVTMSTADEVEAATQQFNGYEFKGRTLRVNAGPPPPREERPRVGFQSSGGGSYDSGHRLYVGNLSWGVDNSALEDLFSEKGKVMDAKVVYDRESGRSRGFGFVTYSTADEANNAISSLDGSSYGQGIEEQPSKQVMKMTKGFFVIGIHRRNLKVFEHIGKENSIFIKV